MLSDKKVLVMTSMHCSSEAVELISQQYIYVSDFLWYVIVTLSFINCIIDLKGDPEMFCTSLHFRQHSLK